MPQHRFLTSGSLFLSTLLHLVIGALLLFSFEFSPPPKPAPKPAVNVVKAAVIDKKQVEKELTRLTERENKRVADEIKRQQELEKKARNAKRKRLQEEKKLAEIKQKKKREEEKRKAEEAKRERLKQEELEKQRKLEQEKKKKAEEQRKRKAAEQERKKKEREQALQEELQAELEAQQQQRDQSVLAKYTRLIQNEIERNFNKLGLPDGLSGVILIRMLQGGTVAEASIVNTSGNELFDRRAVTAVYSASPLPVPEEPRLFEQMRTIRFTFEP